MGTATQLYFEAEKYSAQNGTKFISVTDGSVSNGIYIYVPDGAGSNTTDSLKYNLNINSSGTYYVWLLAYGIDSGSNSVFVNVNNGTDIAT